MVQAYIEWPDEAYNQYEHLPRQQLVHFLRVPLAAFEIRPVTFTVRLHSFRTWDTLSHKYVLPYGTYTLYVGGQQPNQYVHQAPSNIVAATITITQ